MKTLSKLATLTAVFVLLVSCSSQVNTPTSFVQTQEATQKETSTKAPIVNSSPTPQLIGGGTDFWNLAQTEVEAIWIFTP